MRDRLLTKLDDVSAIPYGLDPAEQAIIDSGKNLLADTIGEIAKSAEITNANNQGLWAQLIRMRSKEGRNFIADSLGYDTLTSNWSLEAALPWFLDDFAQGTTYFKVEGGLQRLPNAIAAAYAESGGATYMEHVLRTVRRDDSGRIVLTFETVDGLRPVSAERVILALPLAAIESLDPDSFMLRDDRFRTALKSVKRFNLGKIHLSFDRPWWHGAGYGLGRIVTDLPLRQTYFWGEDATTGMGLAMASYHDGTEANFWDELDTGEAYGRADWIEEARGADGLPLPASLVESLPVSKLMAEEVWYQLKKLHNLPDTEPPPILGTYRNWGDDPLYGAGFHLWRIGADVEATMNLIQEPFANIYICGEAWSRDQGWIKGATSTAETVLQQKFKLPPFLSS